MPFELGAKKAGLSLVRAFMQSIEGVRPYIYNNLVVWVRQSLNATPLITNSRLIEMAKWSISEVHTYHNVVVETLEDAFPCRGDKKWFYKQ